MKSIVVIVPFLLIALLFGVSEGKVNQHDLIRHAQSQEGSYKFVCESGYVLRGRKDWTDQQTEGTAFAGFTCCPASHPDFHYVNENYFCCPAGSGAHCMSNRCDCKTGPLKGGKIPTIQKLA